MQTDTVSIADFVASHRIAIKPERADKNPHMEDRDMDHWKCLLRRPQSSGRKSAMTVYFSKGYGHHGAEPTATEVLSCLADDAAGYENASSFEDWCGEYGYDTDSRKAEKIRRAVERSSKRLKNFLGDELYDALLWHTERE